eukprot:snap_masked-scaffold_14-processed-gene-0.11-mRNA-1 protein AED:1.00 eAED:1.00 QI:0/0/0/0/1/1/2/0/67
MIKVYVLMEKGREICLKCELWWTVEQLMLEIQDKENIRPSEQILFFQGPIEKAVNYGWSINRESTKH